MKPDPHLTLPRVAELTGLSERSLRRWCRDGMIPRAWQPAGRAGSWLIPVTSLLELGLVADVADEAVEADVSAESQTQGA